MISKYSDVEAPSSPPLPLGITGDDWRGLASPDQALGKIPIIRVGPGETRPAAVLQWPAPAQPVPLTPAPAPPSPGTQVRNQAREGKGLPQSASSDSQPGPSLQTLGPFS